MITIPGSEIFDYVPTPAPEILRRIHPKLKLHSVSDEAVTEVDLVTYEVLRHRIWAITDEMGEALKRMSGSLAVTEANDFDCAIMDEVGDEVQVGLYNMELGAAMDMAVKWTLENRSENPGIEEGDMFLCNDPWVGGGIHQNDVSLSAPLFWDGKLFAWTSATAHQVDIGGVAPGSWTPVSENVFWESLPTPPVRIVRNYQLQRDIEDVYLRRSRMPKLVGLDLRAKVGANSLAHDRLRAVIRKYGPDTVKAVMKRMLREAEQKFRAKLKSLPDGTWKSFNYQEQAKQGDRGIYKIVLTMTKKDDRVSFDFRGTDPQVEGMINCTYTGLRAGILAALLPVLCGDIPWAIGGIMRCVDVISEKGTLNNALFPAGICKASVASAWATSDVVQECLSKLVDTHVEHRKCVMSVCSGTWSLLVFAGIDQRHVPFITVIADPMAGGMGARTDQDGVDTGGLHLIPMGRIADVEMNEFMYPLLYLWRREEVDSGGPGKYRGGLSGSSCMIAHDTDTRMDLVVSGSGKSVSMNVGLCGGYPGNTSMDLVLRDTNIRELFQRGLIPFTLGEIRCKEKEVLQAEQWSSFEPSDVYYLFWQGGGGYGDPILRDPNSVAQDVQNANVSIHAARAIYGVHISSEGELDVEATERLRLKIRENRKLRSRKLALPSQSTDQRTEIQATKPFQAIDGNAAIVEKNGSHVIQCVHCSHVITEADGNYLDQLYIREDKVTEGGPQIFPDPAHYIDKKVVFRQYYCPGCFTALLTQIVPSA